MWHPLKILHIKKKLFYTIIETCQMKFGKNTLYVYLVDLLLYCCNSGLFASPPFLEQIQDSFSYVDKLAELKY